MILPFHLMVSCNQNIRYYTFEMNPIYITNMIDPAVIQWYVVVKGREKNLTNLISIHMWMSLMQ